MHATAQAHTILIRLALMVRSTLLQLQEGEVAAAFTHFVIFVVTATLGAVVAWRRRPATDDPVWR